MTLHDEFYDWDGHAFHFIGVIPENADGSLAMTSPIRSSRSPSKGSDRFFQHSARAFLILRILYHYVFVLSLLPIIAFAQETNVSRVSALANGKLLLNGKAADLRTIEQEFKRLNKAQGSVWYYRENPQSEPPPGAMAVVNLVIQYKLPISMSSKPDFSDFIDENGRSQPRKKSKP